MVSSRTGFVVGLDGGGSKTLAAQAVAVARKLDFVGNIPCAVGGGVLSHSPRLVSLMVEMARREGVYLSPMDCVFEPVLGAVRLALDLVVKGYQ